MGYTHYYHFKKNLTKANFNLASSLVKNVIEEAIPKTFTSKWYTGGKKRKLKICGGDGSGKPVFANDHISFNGERKLDIDHETFWLDNTNEHQFCKTARKPYDIAVCMALLRLKDMYGSDFEYSSDGYCPMDTDDYRYLEDEWKKAVRRYIYWCIENGIPTTLLKMKNLPKGIYGKKCVKAVEK